MLPNSQKWVLCQRRTHGHTYKVQTDITFPESTSTCHWGPPGSKAGLGESFNPQDLLRDGHHLRSFGRELTGPRDGEELAEINKQCLGDPGTWRMESVLTMPQLCPATARDRTTNSLEAGPEGSKVVFLLSADHASSTLNVLSPSFQNHLHSRFYVEGH